MGENSDRSTKPKAIVLLSGAWEQNASFGFDGT